GAGQMRSPYYRGARLLCESSITTLLIMLLIQPLSCRSCRMVSRLYPAPLGTVLLRPGVKKSVTLMTVRPARLKIPKCGVVVVLQFPRPPDSLDSNQMR